MTPESMAVARAGAALVAVLTVLALVLLDCLEARIKAHLEARFKASRGERDGGGPE